MPRGYRTGRADQVRRVLAARKGRPLTSREIADAIGFSGRLEVLSATICTLVKAGELKRTPGPKGFTRYGWTGSKPAPAGRLPSPPVPPPRVGMASTTRPTNACAKRPRTPRRPTDSANFYAPLSTLEHSLDPKRRESARIAADIADFERRGGQIERLGVTKLFHQFDDEQE